MGFLLLSQSWLDPSGNGVPHQLRVLGERIFTEDEQGYWESFRAGLFCGQLLTMKNLNRSRSLRESSDLRLSNAAILKLWKYFRLTDSPNFFALSEGLRTGTFCASKNLGKCVYYTCCLTIGTCSPFYTSKYSVEEIWVRKDGPKKKLEIRIWWHLAGYIVASAEFTLQQGTEMKNSRL